MMKKCFRKAGKYLFAALTLALCLFVGAQTADAAKASTVKITEIESMGGKEMAFLAKFPKSEFDMCEVYRGTSENKLKLLDMSPAEWSSWHVADGEMGCSTKGEKGKVTFYANDGALSGDVICYDTGLSIGKTYYYKLVLKDEEGAVLAESNIASAKTKISAPSMVMAYAKTNTVAKISWERPQYAQGYQIDRKDPGKKKWKKVKTVTKAKTTAYTQKKLKSGKTYQYRVRAYRKINGKKVYSDYSRTFTVKMTKPSVKGSYKKGSVYGPYLSTSKLNDVRRVVQGFKKNYIRSGMSNYDKALAAFNFIRANCDYARRGWKYHEANSAWGSLVYGEAQCSGYARGMKALCDAIGVPCKYVHANKKSANPDHQWNMIKIGGKWYILDAQGGFFLVGSKTYKQMGISWSTKGLPACSKKDYKYGGFAGSEL